MNPLWIGIAWSLPLSLVMWWLIFRSAIWMLG